MQPVRSQVCLHQQSPEGDAALLYDPAVHFQSAQLLCQDLLELLGQDGVRSGREEPTVLAGRYQLVLDINFFFLLSSGW